MYLNDSFPLQWDVPSEIFKKKYSQKFVHTPTRWDKENQTVDLFATYGDPRELFPNYYVDYIETLYGRERDTPASMISYNI